MKRKIWISLAICISLLSEPKLTMAQAEEAEQLLLNWEKLTQLKEILNDMYKGYEVVSKGYTTIRDISQGNFSLHQDFLDGLLNVSPEVRKYKRIKDIVEMQLQMVKEYRSAFAIFRRDGNFKPDEIEYISRVYGKLFAKSLTNLDDLLMVITANQLRMSDAERLQDIDRIFEDMEAKLTFVRDFNNSTRVLALNRSAETKEIDGSRKWNGITR